MFDIDFPNIRFILSRKDAEIDLDFDSGLEMYTSWFADLIPSPKVVVLFDRTVFRKAFCGGLAFVEKKADGF